MKNLSKLIIFVFVIFSLFATHYSLYTIRTSAQIPKLKMPCNLTDDPEFHSLRPYQAAPCAGAPIAILCSNDLIFTESFKVNNLGDCVKQGYAGEFFCNPNLRVDEHTLYVELDDSMFPIMGNTEKVQNSQNKTDVFDDATKVNEYASWYLSGINNRAEYGENSLDRVINYSGPVQKLLPSIIQEAQRIETINKAIVEVATTDEDTGETNNSPETHNQIVVCAQENIFGIFGKTKAHECYEGNNSKAKDDVYRIKDWNDGDLSELRSLIENITIGSLGGWNKRYPPLPWSDENGQLFVSDILYRKAYNEWKGKSCAILPIVNSLVCIDNPLIVNKWSELYQYIPLAITPDKKGKEYVISVQPKPSEGTAITNWSYGEIKNAPLYFAHTKEVNDLVISLNKTYTPQNFESVPLPETTEELACTALKVRSNLGDNLFPGDPDEMQIPDVTYVINQAKCKETEVECNPNNPDQAGDEVCTKLDCHAEVIITLKTLTQTPYVEDIWKNSVADSGSIFRKIFPKIEKNAPIECIGNIPTVTNVTYDASQTKDPTKGKVTFKVKNVPEDGATENPQLTFPYVGSIYEYFLKGIQTALRPKGYGEPITNGTLCESAIPCGELPELPKASGSCSLGGISSRIGDIPQSLKDIVEAAAETYKVPQNLILGTMYGEGAFNMPPYQKYDWTDENVKSWATCTPVPGCSTSGDDNFIGFNSGVWDNVSDAIEEDLKALDPNRQPPSQCNLLDAIYGLAWNLHDSSDGSPDFPVNKTCYGKSLNSSNIGGDGMAPMSCDWIEDSWYESAIRIHEFGTGWGDTSNGFLTCATELNSCGSGGGPAAQCLTDTISNTDTCQNDSNANSHNGCVWDVGHGN